ncbi:MAG TPA: hypothetical protein PKL45_08950 [Bacteroidia bacterium]|nr:hypothetical protein [Bacteroidia bacterium]
MVTSILGLNTIQVFWAPINTSSALAYFNPASVSYVTRYNSAGTFQWIRGYKSTEVGPGFLMQSTQGYSIFADPNPCGSGCEVYVGGQQYDYGSNTNGQILGHNYVAYKYNRWGTFFSLMNNNVSATGLAPKVSLKQGAYFPNYTGGPKLILLGDGQWSNPSQGYYGWNMFVYDISSIARFAQDATGIAEDSNNQLSIFLNPTSDNFNVKSNEVIIALKIYTITGCNFRIKPQFK